MFAWVLNTSLLLTAFICTYQKSGTRDLGILGGTRDLGILGGTRDLGPGTPIDQVGDLKPGIPKFSSGIWDPGPLKWDVNE